uniref:Neuropeptide-like 1 n=1 Tax=Bactrocera dorsalis TaxID=27457 RepID=A0A034W6T7_BACDO
MLATFICCSRWGGVGNSCSRGMFTLWPFKWTLLLLLMFLINKVAAKWPPDAPLRYYHQQRPRQYFDDFAIDSRNFDNENSMDGNGNAAFGKTIADEMTLRDLLQSNDIEIPAEERRQRQLQWLGSWLFGQRRPETMRAQQQTGEAKTSQQQQQLAYPPRLLMPLEPAQKQQQTQQLNDFDIHDADIVVYKKTPEFVPGEEKKLAPETDKSANDDGATNALAEGGEKRDKAIDTLTDYDYKLDMSGDNGRYKIEQPLRSKRILYARNIGMDSGYIPYTAYQHERQQELNEAKKLAYKRNKTGNMDQRNFLPSISAGAMTHLGNFFTDLSKNVRYNEKSQPLNHEEAKLLEGHHPLRQLHERMVGEHEANAELLHAIRTYRPSQKIRSLVAMNPRGYHGAQFIDPNYMWVGLGK